MNVLDRCPSCQSLIAKNEELQEQVRQLTSLIKVETLYPEELGLTRSERAIVNALLRRQWCSHDQLYYATYGDRQDVDLPLPQIIAVFTVRIRRKFKPHGIAIETVWGEGYRMSQEDKCKLLEMIE